MLKVDSVFISNKTDKQHHLFSNKFGGLDEELSWNRQFLPSTPD